MFVWINRLSDQSLKNAKDPSFANLLKAFVLAVSGPMTWLAAFVVFLYWLQERLHATLPEAFIVWAFALLFSFLSFFLLKKQCRAAK